MTGSKVAKAPHAGGFIFVAKIPVSTHENVLVRTPDLNEFLRVMDGLGPLFLQWPSLSKSNAPSLGFFLERLIPFLRDPPKAYGWAVEARTTATRGLEGQH